MPKNSITLAAESVLARSDYQKTFFRLNAGHKILEHVASGRLVMTDEQFVEFAEEHLANLSDIALLARIIVENEEALTIREIVLKLCGG